ncbi:MAG TPA: hypothetical protein VF223_20895 [Trebonia sp.]
MKDGTASHTARNITAGSTLAMSVSIHSATSRTRVRFQRRVAEVGEPARTVLTFDQAAGREIGEVSGRQRPACLLLARATTA